MRVAEVLDINLGEHCLYAVLLMCSVGVLRAGFFEAESDVFSATWDAGPVDKFVGNVFGGFLTFGGLCRGHLGRVYAKSR